MKLRPFLHPNSYVFCKVNDLSNIPMEEIVGTFKEDKGWTIILGKEAAIKLQLSYIFESAWISLQLESALEAVGLTALFSQALAAKRISCNVIAAYHHDHIFVPLADAQQAIATLELLDISL